MGSWLFGPKSSVNDVPAAATSLRIQSSVQGRPIPILWGTSRVAGNLLWEGDFYSQTLVVGSVGSNNWFDHIFSKAQPIFQTFYYASMVFGLVHGVITDDDIPCWNVSAQSSAASLGFVIATGTQQQVAWVYLTTNHPANALAYRTTAYVAASALSLGTSANLPNFSWAPKSKVSGFGPAGADAVPADCLIDLFSNPIYGVYLPFYRFDQVLSDYYAYTLASGLVVSPIMVEQRAASEFVSEFLSSTNSAMRWSSGTMSVIPWGTEAITANGATFTPNVTPVYALDDDDFLPNQSSVGSTGSDEPVVCVRKRKSDALNEIKYEFLGRSINYDPVAASAKDEASITAYGLRQSDVRKLHHFALAEPAQLAAQLELGREQILDTFSFTLPPKFILLDVEDIVTLTRDTMGLDEFPVRITEIQENADMSLTFTAEEFLGTASAPFYGEQDNGGFTPDPNADPGDTADIVIFKPTATLASTPAGSVSIWVAACGADPTLYGGSNVYYSTDDVTFSAVGIVAPCTMGTLTATLPSHADPDNVNTLSVDLTESAGVLLPGSSVDVVNGIPPCYVGGEIVAYQNETLTSAFNYDLDILKRGAYGSSISTHSTGTSFILLNAFLFKMNLSTSMVGSTIYFKLQPYNIYGGGLQDITSIPSSSFVIP